MSVTPNSNLTSSLPTDTYKLGLRWLLGVTNLTAPTGEEFIPTLCSGCGKTVDGFGDLLLRCIRLNFSRRQNALQDCLALLLQETGQGEAREVPLPDCPEGDLLPADLPLRIWMHGRDTAVKITIVHGWTA